jgi:hypothetical protein
MQTASATTYPSKAPQWACRLAATRTTLALLRCPDEVRSNAPGGTSWYLVKEPCSGNWSRSGSLDQGAKLRLSSARIVPAYVCGDGVAWLGVGAVVGAVEREVAQRGELRLVG